MPDCTAWLTRRAATLAETTTTERRRFRPKVLVEKEMRVINSEAHKKRNVETVVCSDPSVREVNVAARMPSSLTNAATCSTMPSLHAAPGVSSAAGVAGKAEELDAGRQSTCWHVIADLADT